MPCSICGGNITAGREVRIAIPSQLAGGSACGWCGEQLTALATGELALGMFQQLIQVAGRTHGSDVLQELREIFDAGGHAEIRAQIATARAAEAHEAERRALLAATMPVTSGFSFDDFKVSRYHGFLSSEVVLGMGVFRAFGADFADLFGTESQGLRQRLNEAKAAAFERLREDAVAAGANAILGIDLDYTMFGTTLVGVISSGTAVTIEPFN